MLSRAVLTHAMRMRPAARQEADAAWHAQWSAGVGAIESDTGFRQAVEHGHGVERKSRTFSNTGVVLVGHDEEQVGPPRGRCFRRLIGPYGRGRKGGQARQAEKISSILFTHLTSG
jgi:hypothetical protein